MKRYTDRRPAGKDKPDRGSFGEMSGADAHAGRDAKRSYIPYELNGKEFCRPAGGGYEAKIREHMKGIREKAVHEKAKETRD